MQSQSVVTFSRYSKISDSFCLFVCLGLTSLWNIWGHITTVPACSSGALTNVLPHRNAMPQTQDTTPHPVTVYGHGADLSLCYPLVWNVTLEYTATHFNVLGETRPGNPFPTFHTHQRTFNLMLSWWSTVGSSVESIVPTGSWTRDLCCANPESVLSQENTFAMKSCNVRGWITRIPISAKWHDPLRLPVVSCRVRSDASHDTNRVEWGLSYSSRGSRRWFIPHIWTIAMIQGLVIQ